MMLHFILNNKGIKETEEECIIKPSKRWLKIYLIWFIGLIIFLCIWMYLFGGIKKFLAEEKAWYAYLFRYRLDNVEYDYSSYSVLMHIIPEILILDWLLFLRRFGTVVKLKKESGILYYKGMFLKMKRYQLSDPAILLCVRKNRKKQVHSIELIYRRYKDRNGNYYDDPWRLSLLGSAKSLLYFNEYAPRFDDLLAYFKKIGVQTSYYDWLNNRIDEPTNSGASDVL